MNRKQKRQAFYSNPTRFKIVAQVGEKIIAYLHPTKGYRGNKKAIINYKKKESK